MHKGKLDRKYIIAFGVILVIVILLAVYYLVFNRKSPEDISDANSLVNDAELNFDESNYAQSMKLYYQAMSKDSSNPEVYTGISRIYLIKNRYTDAIKILEQGRLYAKDKDSIFTELGRIYLDRGEIDSAISNLNLALDLDKENVEVKDLLALAYIKISDFDSAMEIVDDISPDSESFYVEAMLTKAVLLGTEVDSALNVLRTAKALDISDSDLESRIDLYINGLSSIQDLDDDDKSDKYVDVILAKSALDAGYEDVTISLLMDYVSDESEYWEIFMYLGQAYYNKSDYTSAETYLLDAYELNPTDPNVSWLLARIYSLNNRSVQTEEFYLRAIEMSEGETKISIKSEYAQLLIDDGQYLSAEEQYSDLKLLDPENDYKYSILIAEANLERSEYEKALDVISSIDVEELSEYWISKYYWLRGSLELESGNREEAKVWALKAVDVDRTSARNYLLLGRIEFDSGDDAKDNLEKAIDLDTSGSISVEAVQILDRI